MAYADRPDVFSPPSDEYEKKAARSAGGIGADVEAVTQDRKRFTLDHPRGGGHWVNTREVNKSPARCWNTLQGTSQTTTY